MTRGLRMPPDLMRELAGYVTEILVERSRRLPEEPAWDGEFTQELSARLQEDPPERGRAPRGVIDRAVRDVLSPTMRHEHPRAFGFVPSAPTWPGVLADYLVTGFNINAATWLSASGPSQLEAVVIDWFRRWLGYPETAGGVLTSGGSVSALDAFVAAREAAGNPARATVYMSDQSHSAQMRSARIIGIRPDRVRVLPTGTDFRLSGRHPGIRRRGRRGRRLYARRRLRRRRVHEHRSRRSPGRHRGLLPGARDLAACRCGVRRFRGRHRARGAPAPRNRAGRFHRPRPAQVVFPAVRHGLPAGAGHSVAREGVRDPP